MPRGDRTGPEGEGPRTGRGLGYCAGSEAPGYGAGGPGMGVRWGRGHGRHRHAGRQHRHWMRWGAGPGWGRFAPPDWGPIPPEVAAKQEVMDLESEAGWLRIQLDAIQARVAELVGPSKEGAETQEG